MSFFYLRCQICSENACLLHLILCHNLIWKLLFQIVLGNISIAWQHVAKPHVRNITLNWTLNKHQPLNAPSTALPQGFAAAKQSFLCVFFPPMNCQTDSGTKTAKVKTKHEHFTCEAKGAPADIQWGGRGLTHCNACGAVQTAVWVYQTGVPDVLAKLPDPSWGTNALEERGMIFKICGRSIKIQSVYLINL